MEARLEPAHGSQFQWHEIKEERAISFSRQTYQLSLCLRRGRVVDMLKIRRLAAKSWAIVNDLAVDLSRCVVNEGHRIL